SIAGPKRPQDRIALTEAASAFRDTLDAFVDQGAEDRPDFEGEGGTVSGDPEIGARAVEYAGQHFNLEHGAVVIAAITSCTNTSNPAVLVAAGLLARNARRRGLKARP